MFSDVVERAGLLFEITKHNYKRARAIHLMGPGQETRGTGLVGV